MDQIRRLGTPREAFDFTRGKEQLVDNAWWHGKRGVCEAYKERAMLRAVRAKFTQNPTLSSMLLATGELILVEHTSNDKFWGDYGCGPPFHDGRKWGTPVGGGKKKVGEI
eukprot:COSAG06_NODE_48854_length_329_cov_0.765217_1_plen_109_part_11